MEKIYSVEELEVYKKAHSLTLELYKVTKKFPREELLALVSQIRRAASSINANLMEGSHRNNKKEYRQFVGISRGSAGELKYHLLLSRDLNYINELEYDGFIDQVNSISKMLYGMIVRLGE